MTDYTQAACRGLDTEIFFPVGRTGYASQFATARAICQRCPIQTGCLEDNLDVEYGVFGGYGPNARRRMRQVAGLPTQIRRANAASYRYSSDPDAVRQRQRRAAARAQGAA